MKQKQAFKSKSTFDKIIQSYIDLVTTTLQPGSVRSYKTSLKNFIGFISSHYPELIHLSDLKRSPHIEEWLSHIAKSNIKKSTRRSLIMHIRRFLNDIYEWGWKDAPCPGLITYKDFPSKDKYLPKPLTPEDDNKLQKTLSHDHKLFPQALLLLRKTGMRIGELMDLEINSLEKVSDDQYVLHVPIGKLHSERIIPVDSETVEIFNRIINLRGNYLPIPNPRTGKPTQFLLVRKNCWKRPSYSGLHNALCRAVKNSGIMKHINPHQLRHSFATGLLRAGISLPALMRLLGHKDIAMTLVYTDVSQQDLHQAYYQAIDKIKFMDLLPKQQGEDKKDGSEYMLDSIDDVITKLHSIRKDSPEEKTKKKLQRIAERLRKAYQDIKDTLD